ncbi:MAG: ComEA family DNA-binding protein [bacterium]
MNSQWRLKTPLFKAFSLTRGEKKILWFAIFLIFLGAATLGLEKWTGQDEVAWAFRTPVHRVFLKPPPSFARRPGYFEMPSILNVNRAPASQLRWVPGMGPGTARKIVQYRSQHGDFKNLSDLQAVPGIGPKKFQKMAPHLEVVSGSGTGENP